MIDSTHQAEFITWLGSEAMAGEDRPAALAGIECLRHGLQGAKQRRRLRALLVR